MKNVSSFDGEALDLIATRFRALAEPLRLRILDTLRGGELSVSELAISVGTTQPNVSKHLKVLQESGMISRRQEGNTVYSSIADPTVFDLCDLVCGSLTERLADQVAQVKKFRRTHAKKTR